MYAIFSILRSTAALRIGLGFALAVGLVVAYLAVDGRGYARGQRDAEDAARLVAYAAAEEAHQYALAEIARGDELSKQLLETQRRLDAKEREYITYANAVVGLIDPSVRVLVEHASGAKTGVPEAPIAPAPAPAAKSPADTAREQAITRAIGANIAINYARLDACIARLDALIDWHEQGDLK